MKKTKFGSGGAMKEGSAKDVREDKKLAKKHGMSMKDWEKSEMDERHDAGVEGMADGGKAGKSKAELLSQIKQKASQIAGANRMAQPQTRAMPSSAVGTRQAKSAQGAATPAPNRSMPTPNRPMSAPMRPTQQAMPAPMRPTQPAVPAPVAPTAMKKGGCVRGMKAGGVTSAEMKKVGRNLARVANQKSSTNGSTKGTMTANKSSGSTAKISKRGWGIARGG